MRLGQDYLRSLRHERGLLRVGCRQGSYREGVQIDYDRNCVEDEIANSVHAHGPSVVARIRIGCGAGCGMRAAFGRPLVVDCSGVDHLEFSLWNKHMELR